MMSVSQRLEFQTPSLPVDLIAEMLLRLRGSAPSLCAAACVCTAWRAVAAKPAVWRVVDARRLAKTYGRLTGPRLASLVRRAGGGLVTVVLDGCDRLKDEDVACLKNCMKLKTLSVVGCRRLTAQGVAEVLVSHPRLKQLRCVPAYQI